MCVVCRVEGRTVRAVLVLESCALQQVVVVQSPAGVEEVGWRGDPRTGRTSVSQSINPVNKQIASLLNSGRVEGRDRPKAGGMLRAQVLACLCSCSTAQKLMQAVRRTGWAGQGQGRAGQGSLFRGAWACSWQLANTVGSLEPCCRFLSVNEQSCLPQQNVNPRAWGVLSRRLSTRPRVAAPSSTS